MTINPININQTVIGPGRPTYIIAEMSANHGQSFDEAVSIILAAKDAGANAIKLQTYTADTITLDCSGAGLSLRGTPWEGQELYELYKTASMPWAWQPKLKEIAADLNLDCFSSPFDATAVEFLEQIKMPAYKVASFELVDLPLIRRIAKTGMPVIMSTGMALLSEIDDAVREFREAGGTELALLKCTSAYPAPPEEMNLRTIPHLSQAFGVPVGLSDHTRGIAIPVAAVALGACVVEKHLTISREKPGPDSAFSLEPAEFKEMVGAIRATEKALGEVIYEVSREEKTCRLLRRSLFVTKNIKRGDVFTLENVRSLRPGNGLPPKWLPYVIGKSATDDLRKGTPLEMIHVGIQNEHA